jgi:hypothetical protein
VATVHQWGRKESIIWPPRGYVYTLGAFIFSCISFSFVPRFSGDCSNP